MISVTLDKVYKNKSMMDATETAADACKIEFSIASTEMTTYNAYEFYPNRPRPRQLLSYLMKSHEGAAYFYNLTTGDFRGSGEPQDLSGNVLEFTTRGQDFLGEILDFLWSYKVRQNYDSLRENCPNGTLDRFKMSCEEAAEEIFKELQKQDFSTDLCKVSFKVSTEKNFSDLSYVDIRATVADPTVDVEILSEDLKQILENIFTETENLVIAFSE